MLPVVIGSSAGGPNTLKKLLLGISDLRFPVVVAQHNLASEVENFAKWIAFETKRKIVLVNDKEIIRDGRVYFPSKGNDILIKGKNMVTVEKSNGAIAPSIDRLFESAARCLKEDAFAIVLGGLGTDGVRGARKIVESGGKVIVQSDPEFGYLPEMVFKNTEKVARRSLEEIILILETLVR